MEEWVNLSTKKFDVYYSSFNGLTEEQQNNFKIKKDHSIRVAETALQLAERLDLGEKDKSLAFFIGLFHDIGRFKQLVEYNTFDDSKSVDHADYSLQVLKDGTFFDLLDEKQTELAMFAIANHNKRNLPKGMSEEEILFAKIIRDADKLDILKVLTDYYSNPRARANHTLTWEMPTGTAVSKDVWKEVVKGSLVSKEKVESQLDIKVMQLSWVYDINFKSSFEVVMKNRFLEKIYNSMPKNDKVIEIYRTIKVYAENKFLG
ncbi:HD domain-containing protein [Prolixibacteraceae bacterium Z1-6]|uniref:HD domain-containing protein n=1 Tax=Draconibacterium aestuarii TaxID=2998507 RepID=A0A9X3J4Y1_9BACT|nr:HD domain-containing protein [Prolixibacteraceae bacterium Z1-6]